MVKGKDSAMDALSRDLRKQIGNPANARLLRRMPIFAVDHSLPDDLSALLGDLEKAERRHANSKRH
jgi:hypothetical protein